MSLEDFIYVHKGSSPTVLLKVLDRMIDFYGDDKYAKGYHEANHSKDNEEYFQKEADAMRNRINWLISEIKKGLEDNERP